MSKPSSAANSCKKVQHARPQRRARRRRVTRVLAEEDMKKTLIIMKWFLIVLGGLTLLGGGFFVYKISFGNRDKVDSASSKDVRFVLNWCELGDSRIEKVVRSHESARSLTGDHLDAYAIKIKDVSIEELTAKKGDMSNRWYRGDQIPKVLDETISFVGSWLGSGEIAWFPKEAELRSSEVYVYPWTIYYHGLRPTAAEIIFVRPKDKMIFFFSGKT
jgi:hypothetical protein